jgi:cation diffusion facilitator family transporter
VLAGAAAAKYALYRYVLGVAEDHQSPALRATAVDNRNDILTAGAALVGVVGAGAGYPLLDPLAAVVVAVAILYTGMEIVRDNVNYLVGAAPPEGLRREIVRRALVHPDVEGAHDVIAHYVGPEVDVSLHVEVSGEKTLREAHAIETGVKESIEELPEVDDAFVHVDPKELGEWKDDSEVDRLAEADAAEVTDDDG